MIRKRNVHRLIISIMTRFHCDQSEVQVCLERQYGFIVLTCLDSW